VVVDSGGQGFLDFLGGDRLFFFLFLLCPLILLFVGSFGERRRGWAVSIYCVQAAADTFLELGMACKPQLQEKRKAATVKDG
jgi:hypothetical protein